MTDELIVSPSSSLPSTNNMTLNLGRVLQRLRITDGAEMLAKVVMDFLREQFDRCPLIWLGLYDRRNHTIVGKGGVIPGENHRRALRLSFSLAPGDPLEQVVIQQRLIYIANLQRERNVGEWSRAARQAGIRSVFVLPITARQQCFGVLVLGAERTGLKLDTLETTQLTIVLGEFANILCLRELEEQRLKTQHPHTVLLDVADHLQGSDPFGARIHQVLQSVQRFMQPTTTELYWLDTDRQCFVSHELATTLAQHRQPTWMESGSNVALPPELSATLDRVSIPSAEVVSFLDHLLGNQPVTVGEAYSSLTTADTSKLMFQLKARSVLAAPIWFRQGDRPAIFGFVTTVTRSARRWTQEEQRFLHGVARNIALATASYRDTRQYEELHTRHQATLALAPASPPQATDTAKLEAIVEAMLIHLKVERLALLELDRVRDAFVVLLERSSRSPQGGLPSPLPSLNLIDYQLLERSTQAIALHEIRAADGTGGRSGSRFGADIDVRLSVWQPHFAAAGWQSIALCNVYPGTPPEFLIVVGHSQPHNWEEPTLALLQWSSQQLAIRLDHRQLDRSNQQLQTAIATLTHGLSALQSTQNNAATQTLNQVQRLLDANVTLLLQLPSASDAANPTARNTPPTAHIAAVSQSQPEDLFVLGTPIAIASDPILQHSLTTDGFLGPLLSSDLPAATLSWLGDLSSHAIYLLALRPDPQAAPSAIFVAVSHGQRWDDRLLSPARVLLETLIHTQHRQQILHQLATKRHTLEPLTWYKHRQLESLYWIVGTAGRQIERLASHLSASDPRTDLETTTRLADPSTDSNKTDFRTLDREQLYGQQTLRLLSENLSSLKASLQHEQWQLNVAREEVSLVKLLKHVLDRCEPILKKRQLWLQVHREGNATIQGDRHKLELVFYELLTWACQRSAVGDRLDIWYRPITLTHPSHLPDQLVLELAITDSGTINPHLVTLLQHYQNQPDAPQSNPPELEQPPGLYLTVYHRVLVAMGGDFYLDVLEDGRVATRLMIPMLDAPS